MVMREAAYTRMVLCVYRVVVTFAGKFAGARVAGGVSAKAAARMRRACRASPSPRVGAPPQDNLREDSLFSLIVCLCVCNSLCRVCVCVTA